MADSSTGNPLLLEKEQIHARVPPELLIQIDVTTDILKSFYLLPSVMHRLQSLMLASQLRSDIGCAQHIPSSLVRSSLIILHHFYFAKIVMHLRNLISTHVRYWKLLQL
jgi:endoribonuclease Dicer